MAWFWFVVWLLTLAWSTYLLHLVDILRGDLHEFAADITALVDATKED